jgi:hypothetical protein
MDRSVSDDHVNMRIPVELSSEGVNHGHDSGLEFLFTEKEKHSVSSRERNNGKSITMS